MRYQQSSKEGMEPPTIDWCPSGGLQCSGRVCEDLPTIRQERSIQAERDTKTSPALDAGHGRARESSAKYRSSDLIKADAIEPR